MAEDNSIALVAVMMSVVALLVAGFVYFNPDTSSETYDDTALRSSLSNLQTKVLDVENVFRSDIAILGNRINGLKVSNFDNDDLSDLEDDLQDDLENVEDDVDDLEDYVIELQDCLDSFSGTNLEDLEDAQEALEDLENCLNDL